MGRKCIGIGLAIFGAIALLAGIFVGVGLLTRAGKALKTAAQHPLAGEKGYDKWADSAHEDAAGLYYDVYMFNITNAADVANALAAPAFTEVGPYSFREYCRRINTTSSEDESRLTFYELCYKNFVPSRSIDKATGRQLSEDDQVTSINTFYYGALTSVGAHGSDAILAANSAGGMFAGIVNNYFKAFRFAEWGGAANVEPNMAAWWGNSTANDAASFTSSGNVVTTSARIGVPASFGLAEATFEFNLFCRGKANLSLADGSDPVAMAILNPLTAADIQIDATVANTILFGIRGLLNPNAVHPTNGKVGYGMALYLATVSQTNAATASLLFWGSGTLDATQSNYLAKYVQYLGLTFLNPTYKAVGAKAPDALNPALNHYFWTRSVRLHMYFDTNNLLASMLGRGANQRSASFMTMTDCPAEVIAAKSASRQINGDNCQTEFSTNNGWTSNGKTNKFIFNTGKENIKEVDQLYTWMNQTELVQRVNNSGNWCNGDLPIRGRRDPGVAPAEVDWSNWMVDTSHFKKGFKFDIWNSDTMRTATFAYNKKMSVRGVKAHEFRVDYDAMLGPDSFFDQSIYGVLNMTCIKSMVPIMFTLPHFNKADLNSTTWHYPALTADADNDDIKVFVEPNTGLAIKAQLMLQINLLVPKDITGITKFAAGTTQDTLFPLFYLNKNSEMTEDNEDTLKLAQGALKVPQPFLIAGCIVGPIALAVAIYLILTAGKAAGETAGVTSSQASGGSTHSTPYELDEVQR